LNEAVAVDQIDWSVGIPMTAGPYFVGLYQPSPETAGFWEGVTAGEIRLKECKSCGRLWHPKRIVCTHCSSTDMGWKKAAGTGEVYSFSEVHRTPSPVFEASAPYTVGVVRLDEGVHLFTRFVCEPGSLQIGTRVGAEFKRMESGQLMPVFVAGGR